MPTFSAYPLSEYPSVTTVEFPEELPVAYAVCGRECGRTSFIVDGQTQVCEHCGRLMFRTEVRKYVLAPAAQPAAAADRGRGRRDAGKSN